MGRNEQNEKMFERKKLRIKPDKETINSLEMNGTGLVDANTIREISRANFFIYIYQYTLSLTRTPYLYNVTLRLSFRKLKDIYTKKS